MAQNKKILNGWCICGLILAIISFVDTQTFFLARMMSVGAYGTFYTWFGSFFSLSPFLRILAVVLCIIGLATIKKHPEYSGKRYGIAGLIIGSLAILEAVIFAIILINVSRD